MAAVQKGIFENGIYRVGDVRISDLSGRKMLPIGDDLFATTVGNSVFVDKTMLIADVLDSGYKATLFCRPRRFGKSLNLNMMQRFFEIPSSSDPAAMDTTPLFKGLAIWDAGNGRYREHHAAYPVICLSLKNLKTASFEEFIGGMSQTVADEFQRHKYLMDSDALNSYEQADFDRLASRTADRSVLAVSLLSLSRMLFAFHGKRCIILIDEYDAPVMAAYTNDFYNETVAFLKSWLTAALKGNEALAFACLTGVQRISKESIFSDLNNLVVDTALNVRSDERFGFTNAEVTALAEYLGETASVDEVRYWYDGYRFGNVDIYNPWSVLNYFQSECAPDVYWGNTSGNTVLGDIVRTADERTMEGLYALMKPNGTVSQPLDLGIVFPDIGVRSETLWSMLYLAGYLTTNDTELPNRVDVVRALRVPNQEIRQLYRSEILARFVQVVGDRNRLVDLHRALVEADGQAVEVQLTRILLDSASYFDLTSENSYHMLVMGLLFGVPGYSDPVSNREAGRGRFDIRLSPLPYANVPMMTVELKCVRSGQGDTAALVDAARDALMQIAKRAYDDTARGSIRFGMAFSGKQVAVAAERL